MDSCYRCNEEFIVARKQHINSFKCRSKSRGALCNTFESTARTINCPTCYAEVQGHYYKKHKESNRCKFINSMNPLEKIVYCYPDKFDYQLLSKNPMVTMDLIEIFPHKKWDWVSISRNFTKERREKYPEKNWFDVKSPDTNTVVNLKKATPVKEQIDYTYLEPFKFEKGVSMTKNDIFYFSPEIVSQSPSLRVDWIREMEHYPWNWTLIAKNIF